MSYDILNPREKLDEPEKKSRFENLKEKTKYAIAKGRVKAHKARMGAEYKAKNYLAERKEYHQSPEYKEKVAAQKEERKRKINKFTRNVQKQFKEPSRRSSRSSIIEESSGLTTSARGGFAGIGESLFSSPRKTYRKKTSKKKYPIHVTRKRKSYKKKRTYKRKKDNFGFGIGKSPGFKL